MTLQVNECAWRAVSGGLGEFVVASALTGYYTPAQCTTPAVVDGGVYHYRAESDDLTQYESGQGTYDASLQRLIRDIVYQSSNGGDFCNFSAAPKVRLSAAAQDIGTDWETLNDTQFPGAWKVLTTVEDETNPPQWRDRGPQDLAVYEAVNMAFVTSVNGQAVYSSYIDTDGSGGPNVLTLGSGIASGQRKSIAYVNQPDPGDTLELVSTNIRNVDGSTPASITFGLFTEITLEYLAQSGVWFIVPHLTTATIA